MFDTPTIEGLALVTMKPNSILPNNNYRGSAVSRSPINKDDLWCVFCKTPRHTKEICWKLHGKPQSFGRGYGNQYAQFEQRNHQTHIAQSNEISQPEILASNDSNVGRLHREEIERLYSILTSMDKPTTSYSRPIR